MAVIFIRTFYKSKEESFGKLIRTSVGYFFDQIFGKKMKIRGLNHTLQKLGTDFIGNLKITVCKTKISP